MGDLTQHLSIAGNQLFNKLYSTQLFFFYSVSIPELSYIGLDLLFFNKKNQLIVFFISHFY